MPSSTDETPPLGSRFDRRFVLFVLCFYAAWGVRVVLLMPVDGRIEAEWLQQCWSQGLRLAIWVVPPIVYLRYVDGVRALSFLKLDCLPRDRRLVVGAGIIAAFMVITATCACLVQGGDLGRFATLSGARWVSLVAWASYIAFAEELLFRGFVFQKFRATHSFALASVSSAGLFLLIHWPGWLYMQGFHSGLLPLSASILLVGWVLALELEVTQSLWPPILLHVLNNILSTTIMA